MTEDTLETKLDKAQETASAIEAHYVRVSNSTEEVREMLVGIAASAEKLNRDIDIALARITNIQ